MKLTLVSGFAGGALLARALSDGLRCTHEVHHGSLMELEARFLAVSAAAHRDASTFQGSIGAYHPAELSIAYEGLRIGEFGIPCNGASKAGRSKNGLSAPEEHPDVGYLFLPTMHFVRQHRLDICVFENVPEYQSTASATAIREALTASGYALTEWVLNSHADFGTATERKRWVMVASKRGKFEWQAESQPFRGTIDRLLDSVSERDEAESATPEQVTADAKFLARKAAEGCGFRMRLLDRAATKVPTIAKSYGKRQPSASFLRTKTSYRPFRPREVLAFHGFPSDFALPEGKTLAYELIGQGVCYPPFFELGRALGNWIASGFRSIQVPRPIEFGQLELFAA